MSGIDKRLAEAIRAVLYTDAPVDGDVLAVAAAVAPLVEEARAEGYADAKAAGVLAVRMVTEAAKAARSEGYAAALTDATDAIKEPADPSWLLCTETGEVGFNTKAPSAPKCPVHGGAGCLGVYVRQSSLLGAVARLGKADASA